MNTIIEKTVTKPVLLQVFYFELDREGIKGREDGRGWGDYSREAIILNILVKVGRLFEGGDHFKYFGQSGAIIRGTAIIPRIYGF